jgi:hypothetical protein
LPFGETPQIQALFEFPHDALTDDEIASLEMQLESIQGYPAKVRGPEQVSRTFVKAALEAIAQAKDEDDE